MRASSHTSNRPSTEKGDTEITTAGSETFTALGTAVGGLIAYAMKQRRAKKTQQKFEQGMEPLPPEADPLP